MIRRAPLSLALALTAVACAAPASTEEVSDSEGQLVTDIVTMEVDAADVEIIAQALAAQEANAAPPPVPPSLPSSPLRLSTPPPVPVGLPVVAPLSPTIEERVSYEPPLAAAPRPPFATLFRVGRESSNLALVALAASGVAFLTSLVALAAALTALTR